ncbi:uncharacterized protein LOC144751124 [Ciona intestinalis]
MSLDLSRHRMEGISGLSLMSPPQRSFINNMMKQDDSPNSEHIGSYQSNYGMHSFIRGNMGYRGYGSPYAFVPHAGSSPQSPKIRNESNNESERKERCASSASTIPQWICVHSQWIWPSIDNTVMIAAIGISGLIAIFIIMLKNFTSI